MIIKNSNISIKYFKPIFNENLLRVNLATQILLVKKQLKLYNTKSYCIYTHRYRSVFSSYKMSRHKMKEFFDVQTFSNMYIKWKY